MPSTPTLNEDYDDHLDDEPDEEDDFYLDCGLGLDGQCSKAGSEECDWECPHSRGPRYAGSVEWNKAHNAGVPVDGCECRECRNRPPSHPSKPR